MEGLFFLSTSQPLAVGHTLTAGKKDQPAPCVILYEGMMWGHSA